jgi:hypothetical protein
MPVGENPSAIVAANLAACANLDETDATALLRFVDLPLYFEPPHICMKLLTLIVAALTRVLHNALNRQLKQVFLHLPLC